jgi:hypothetical protein
MDGKTIRLLSEYIADQHRRERERNANSGYEKIYVQDTNGIEDDTEVTHLETFWPSDNKD